MSDSFSARTAKYQNTGEVNDAVFREFTERVREIPWLRVHRDVIERNDWGTGDRAFHYHWYLLLQEAARRFGHIELLEIGVFKGQVISLWSLIAHRLGIDAGITAVSPLTGSVSRKPRSRVGHKIRMMLDADYRNLYRDGNVYATVDYEAIVADAFATFELDFAKVRIVRGFSQDAAVLEALRDNQFHIVYIDGDHSYEGAKKDIEVYSAKVAPGGWLVMDDAACDCPGTAFWKGHDSVTRACAAIPAAQFRNVFNIGHNRVFERVG